jgi:hypothetical protein
MGLMYMQVIGKSWHPEGSRNVQAEEFSISFEDIDLYQRQVMAIDSGGGAVSQTIAEVWPAMSFSFWRVLLSRRPLLSENSSRA